MCFYARIFFFGLKIVNYLIDEFVYKRGMRAMPAFGRETMLQIVGNKVKNHTAKIGIQPF